MSTLNEIARQICERYPLIDVMAGQRYRIVDELAGLTELEAANGEPRYVATDSLEDSSRWQLQC